MPYSQARNSAMKKTTNSQERRTKLSAASPRPIRAPSRTARSASALEDAIAMEDRLDVAHMVDEGAAFLDLQIARIRQVDRHLAVDASGPRRDDADLARQLHGLLDAVGDEDHRRA